MFLRHVLHVRLLGIRIVLWSGADPEFSFGVGAQKIVCAHALGKQEATSPLYVRWGPGPAYTGWPKKNGTVDFLGLCSDQQLSFFTLLDRASFPHYNNIKFMKLG